MTTFHLADYKMFTVFFKSHVDGNKIEHENSEYAIK